MRKPESASSSRAPSRWSSQTTRQALCLALLLALPGGAQNRPSGASGGLGQPISHDDPLATVDNQNRVEDEKRMYALNAMRQKSLVADTNKLLRLAAELDAEVNSEHPDSLTYPQLRKLAEIEKLAHSIKEKMSASVWGAPGFPTPFAPDAR
jgi:hypothetical protein